MVLSVKVAVLFTKKTPTWGEAVRFRDMRRADIFRHWASGYATARTRCSQDVIMCRVKSTYLNLGDLMIRTVVVFVKGSNGML
ncbi:hypothetical protein PspR76_30315 [Pseudomonas sp. R76]|nr:hypothetical protein PspR76_30315 [Pseudomonas sp. R76]